MTIELGSPESGSPSTFNLGAWLAPLPLVFVTFMAIVVGAFVFVPADNRLTVRYEQARLANVSAAKLRFISFTRGQQWLLAAAYFVNPWASDRAVVGDLVPTSAIADSPEIADAIGQQISKKALYLAREIPGIRSAEYEAVWYADIKPGELGAPIDAGSRESLTSFLNDFGASMVILPIVTTPFPDKEFERVISWGQEIRHTSPPEGPRSNDRRSPT